jgi:hypothetical protein
MNRAISAHSRHCYDMLINYVLMRHCVQPYRHDRKDAVCK